MVLEVGQLLEDEKLINDIISNRKKKKFRKKI